MKKHVALIMVAVAIGMIVTTGVRLSSQPISTSEEKERSFYEYSAATNNIEPTGEPIPVTPRLIEYGKWVYRGLCIGCHGTAGDGNGAVWELADVYAPEHKLPRKPRDFTQAVFKIRSTPSGSFPTDNDLFQSISRGLVADLDMPSFKFLPERDRWAVIAYIKTFSNLWIEEAQYQDDPIAIGEPPIPDAQMLVAGKEVYKNMKCAKCHGELGKGDGPSAAELEDDSGLPILPRDFSYPDQFVGGSDAKDIYRTFNTGLDGTPMPSFMDFLDEQKSWQLVWYVMSLRPDWNLQAVRQQMLRARGEEIVFTSDGRVFPTSAIRREQGDPPAAVQPEPDESESQMGSAEISKDEQTDMQIATAESTSEPKPEQQRPDVAEQPEAADAAASGNYKTVEVSAGGTIQGKVIFNGVVKQRTVLPTKDKSVCGGIRKEPSILVGEGGAVEDSIVYLKGVSEGKPWQEMVLRTPVLDQKGCAFEPHVQVARQGNIDIINSDPVLHNTHGYYGKRTAFNVALPTQGEKVTKALKRSGTVRVDCDAHGWMLGWVQVVENPYFAQTGADGVFTITDIPPGDYTLVVWQESLGDREFPVTVTAGKETELAVDLTK